METIFTENWEQRLEMQSLKNGRCRKRAYICSPLSAEKDVDFLRNMHSARAYMYYAFEKMEMYARAPHAYLPMLLCDRCLWWFLMKVFILKCRRRLWNMEVINNVCSLTVKTMSWDFPRR